MVRCEEEVVMAAAGAKVEIQSGAENLNPLESKEKSKTYVNSVSY